MSLDKIQIGIVGCGWIATNAYLPAIQEIGFITAAAVYDPIAQNAQDIALKYDISKVCLTYEELLESEVEAVIICSPNYTHKDLVVKALHKNIHVLCEKPVAMNKQEMQEINHAVKKSRAIFMPSFVNRFREDIKQYIKEIQSGSIGEVISVEGIWVRESGIPRPGTWFTNKEKAGGGVLIDLGSHIIDICMLITGGDRIVRHLEQKFTYDCNENQAHKASWFEYEQRRSERIDVESRVRAEVCMDNGKKVRIDLAWESEERGDYTQFKVYGTKGVIQLDTLFGFSSNKKWKNTIIYTSAQGKNKENVIVEPSYSMSFHAFRELLICFGKCAAIQNNTLLNIDDGKKTAAFIDDLYLNEG